VRRSTLLGLALVASATAGAELRALQQQPAPPPAGFEVASVKENKAGPQSIQRFVLQPGDHFTAVNFLLRNLITEAYRAEEAQLADPPNWIDDARYDIVAKAEKPVSRDEMRLMLRSLLMERFQLAVHTEMREGPIFALVLAHKDGALGPHLRRAAKTCEELRAEAASPDADPCGFGSVSSGFFLGRMQAHGFTLANVMAYVQREAGRRIVDKTGLSGAFDWELTFTPQVFLNPSFPRDRFTDVDRDGPSIFTALQEQWGLKLEPQKDLGKVLVIDHVERPTPN